MRRRTSSSTTARPRESSAGPPTEALGRPLSMLIPERFQAAHAGHVRRFGETGVTSRRHERQRPWSTAAAPRAKNFRWTHPSPRCDAPGGKLLHRHPAGCDGAGAGRAGTVAAGAAAVGPAGFGDGRHHHRGRAAEHHPVQPGRREDFRLAGRAGDGPLPGHADAGAFPGRTCATYPAVRSHRRHVPAHGRQHRDPRACAAAAKNSRWMPRSRSWTRPRASSSP